MDKSLPPLPECWSGSPVTITWKEDGETTTREVYTADQMRAYARAALQPQQVASADRGEAVAWQSREAGTNDEWSLCLNEKHKTATAASPDWEVRPLYAATPPSPAESADTSTGDDARHARENPPPPLPPATLLYENEGDGTKVYGYTAEQMQSRPAAPSGVSDARALLEKLIAQWSAAADECDAMAARVGGNLELERDASQYRQTVYQGGLVLAALDQPQPGRVEGMVLVPVEPTKEMRHAGRDAHHQAEKAIEEGSNENWNRFGLRENRAAHVYAAMIAAAPTAGGAK